VRDLRGCRQGQQGKRSEGTGRENDAKRCFHGETSALS
jgi:hypothetical protein